MLFHHDNAPTHISAAATAKLVELGYELLPRPSYSPDLVSVRLLFVSKLEEVTRLAEIFVE